MNMMPESVCARSIHRYIAWCDLVSSRGWTFRCKQILSKIKTGNESLVTFKTGDSLSAPWRTLHLSHIQGIFSNWEEWRERVVRFSCGSLTGEVTSGSLCDSIAGRRHGIPTIYGTGSHRFVPLVEWGCMEDIILMWVHRSHFISSGMWKSHSGRNPDGSGKNGHGHRIWQTWHFWPDLCFHVFHGVTVFVDFQSFVRND